MSSYPKSTDSRRGSKAAGGEVARLKAELTRIEREVTKLAKARAAVEETIVAKATEAEQSKREASGIKPAKRPRKQRKWGPPEPYEGFPLTPHVSGRWMKKINGTLHYFGHWGRRVSGKVTQIEGETAWWQPALALYNAQKDDLYAGRKPRATLVNGEVTTKPAGLTVKALCDEFYTDQKARLDRGEIAARTLAEYDETCERMVKAFGRDRLVTDLDSDDFKALLASVSETWGPVRRANFVQRVRTVFNHALKEGWIEGLPRFGATFKKPSRAVLRKHRHASDKRLFTAEEVRRLIDHSDAPLKAMVLLGINCAFGNADCGKLPLKAVDLDKGWIDFPRPKTGIERRCPLWPETVAAIREAIERRPVPKDEAHAGLVFITKYGGPWAKDTPDSPVSGEFGKLLYELDINGRRGLGFYSLRHTFRTEADKTLDFPAARLIMGHADDSIDAAYREGIDDDRLRRVVEHVRRWVFPPKSKSKRAPKRTRSK